MERGGWWTTGLIGISVRATGILVLTYTILVTLTSIYIVYSYRYTVYPVCYQYVNSIHVQTVWIVVWVHIVFMAYLIIVRPVSCRRLVPRVEPLCWERVVMLIAVSSDRVT